MAFVLIFENASLAAYPDVCAASMMYTTTVPATVASSDGRVMRASASGAADSGLIPTRVKAMTSKLVFTDLLLDAQHLRDCVENKPISLLVVPLGSHLAVFSRVGVADRWPKRAGYSALIAFSW